MQGGLGPGVSGEARMLGLRQAQTLPQALGIGLRAHRECREAAHGIRLGFCGDEAGEPAEIADPPIRRCSRPVSDRIAMTAAAPGATRSFRSSPRTRSRERSASPSRASIDAASPSGSGAPAP